MAADIAGTLAPEARLLLELGRDDATADDVQRLLARPVHWTRFAQLAQREQAFSIVAGRLAALGGSAVPPEVAGQLERFSRVSGFHLAQLRHRFEQAVGVLAGAGIDALLLKGAGLAYTAYASFAQRPMSDVDILLRPGEAWRAQELLGGAGWSWAHEDGVEAFYADHHHLPPLRDTQGLGSTIELHTGLFIAGHPLGLSAEAVWADARTVAVAGSRAWVPHPHHQLLQACLHFAWSHMMHSGAWRTFRDVAAIVRAGGVDWPTFVALAEASRGASSCYWTFELARTLGGVQCVPEWVVERLRPPGPRVVRDWVRRHVALTLFPSESVSPSVQLDRLVWEAAILPGHSGHGAVRPWAQEDRLVTRARAAEGRRASRLVAGLHKAGAYGRYLRTMLAR